MVIIVMGVCGSGKTSVGRMLADRLGCGFVEGDDYHPPENIAKMSRSDPLDDADRRPWLEAMAADIDAWLAVEASRVLACSALKRRYRDILIGPRQGMRLVHLMGSRSLIQGRLKTRSEHFMPPGLLASQYGALEPPVTEERPIIVDVAAPVTQVVDVVVSDLQV